MPIPLPTLPYDRTALEPHLSGETVDLHGSRQRGYVERLNGLVSGTAFADMPLEQIVRQAQGAMAECAAQAWATALYWESIKPAADGGGEPEERLTQALVASFGSVDGFRERFTQASLRGIAPGWAWLLQRADGRLAIAVTPHSVTPLTGPDRALLACSLWEHAYLLDYPDDRRKYLDAFWQLVDWQAVSNRMTA